jgi:hypothetical protein
MCQKTFFQVLLLIATKMAVLSDLWQGKGLGPLGVKILQLDVMY